MRLALLTTVWFALVIAGMAVLWNYQFTPGTPAGPPDRWPLDSELKPSKTLPTLVMVTPPIALVRALASRNFHDS